MASKQILREETENYILTTIEWNSMPEYGGSGSLETGIHPKNGDSFKLIQHGWYRAEDAHSLIKKALQKGWDASRIYNVMNFIKERK